MTSPWGGGPRNLQRLTRKDQDQSASTGWARMELSPDCPSLRPSVKVILLVPGNSLGHPGRMWVLRMTLWFLSLGVFCSAIMQR